MSRFEACLAITLGYEGGYSDDPHDPGGPTMAGIIQRVYDAWRAAGGLEPRHVKEIELQEIHAIYWEQYWLAVSGEQLPPGIDLAVWDFGVNSGPHRAIKALQKALCVTADGHLGAVTLEACLAADPVEVIEAIHAERQRFLRQIKTFWRFGKGWTRRNDGIREKALAMVAAADASMPATAPPLGLVLAAKAESGAETGPEERGTAKATIAPETTSMASSTTGWAAVIGGLAAVASLLREANAVSKELIAAGANAGALKLKAPGALTNPWFWIAAAGVGVCVYIWLERARKARLS